MKIASGTKIRAAMMKPTIFLVVRCAKSDVIFFLLGALCRLNFHSLPRSRKFKTDALPSFVFPVAGVQFVISALQATAQMKYRIMLAREQRVDAEAGCGGEFLEAAAIDFVSQENVALLPGQFVEGVLERFQ